MDGGFIFYDYLDADSGGENVIRSFLDRCEKSTKAFLNSMIRHLEASPFSTWREPYTKPLDGAWEGFFEIRKQGRKTRARLVFKIENRQVFLVATGFHRSRWQVDITPAVAKQRVCQMTEHPELYRRRHDFK